MVTWRQDTDLLRCSPTFFKAGERYDSIIYHDFGDTYKFGKLVFAFVCSLSNGERHPLLLVQPMTQVNRRQMDTDLGLYPFKAEPRSQCRLIHLNSLVRGAVLYEDISRAEHYFAVDVIDSDMFLRLKTWFGPA